ncbi:MAG: peptidase M22 [Syntrophomonadaceae bacterium]|nr:peptidase M22 [Syntrophomonadaceae bacterium]
MNLYLGIDTSAYTTSIAVVDDQFNIVWDKRIPLEVKKGDRGLRQSEALFLHIKNLPLLFSELSANRDFSYKAMAVSSIPRPIANSYMPVFKAGEFQAISVSSMLNVPLYKVSHQEGHIMAGICNNKELLNEESFLAAHFSGGTSEFLEVKKGTTNFFDINMAKRGLDLHAGQLIDRVGVRMGLSFPSGPELEALALQATNFDVKIPSSVKAEGFSFSGAETMAAKLVEKNVPHTEIAFAVLRVIANTIEKCVLEECERYKTKKVLLVGGVMANSLIKKRLIERLEHPAVGIKLYFAEPHLSTDNAVGVALLGMLLNKKRDARG